MDIYMCVCVNMFLFIVFILNVYQLSCSSRTTTLSIRTRNTLLFCPINYLTLTFDCQSILE